MEKPIVHIDGVKVRELRDWAYAYPPKQYGSATYHPMLTRHLSPATAMRKFALEHGAAVGVRADDSVIIMWRENGKICQRTYKPGACKITWNGYGT